jgi:hypothetical protein
VVRGDQSLERRAIQVTVDNTLPSVRLVNPEPNTSYEFVADPLLNDWINYQADAQDNFSMNRVEYYLDNQKVGESTVAPFTFRWNVTLNRGRVSWEPPVYETRVITAADGSIIGTEQITVSYVISVTQPITDPVELATLPPGAPAEKIIGYQKVFSNGLSMIDTALGYTNTHTVHVVAYDSAGNEAKSEPVQVMIVPRREEETDEESEGGDGAYLSPALLPTPTETAFARRQERPPVAVQSRDSGG